MWNHSPSLSKKLQKNKIVIKALAKNRKKYEVLPKENTKVICKEGKLVILKSLQRQEVQWYHHYLQYPGHTHLEETLCAAM
jgi:hypothetical protein